MDAKELGNLLSGLLQDKGLSQRKLARLSGVDRGYINSICKGKHSRIGWQVAEKLAKYLGVQPTIFFSETFDIADQKIDEQPEDLIRRALITFPDTVPIYDPEEFTLRLHGPVEASDFVYRRKYAEYKNVVGCYAFGHCLEPEIHDGDILIVDDNATPDVGDIAVCLVEDKLHTGKIELIDSDKWLVNHHGRMNTKDCQRCWLIIEVRRRLK